ncbi:MAG: DUF6455 family protein [Roseovarius sp.]
MIRSHLPLNDPTQAFFLTRSIARALSVNLSEVMHHGAFTPGDYAKLINQCRACGRSEQCMAWLAGNGAGAERAPEFCPNGPTLEELAKTIA